MWGRFGRACLAGLVALVLWIGVGVAQDADGLQFEAWERVATRAQATLNRNTLSDEALNALRVSIVDWRERFLDGTEANADAIAALEVQIEALGPPPAEGESESDEIAERRTELNAALAEARAPRVAAEEAFARADALIGQIDERLRARQTDALLERQGSPLQPALWGDTVNRLGRVVSDVRAEVRGNIAEMREAGTFWNNLPLVVLFLAGAIALISQGPHWVERLIRRLESRTSQQAQIVLGFVISLGTIALPLIGISLINAAVISTGILGQVGRATALGLNAGIIAFAVARWLGTRIFPEGSAWPTPVILDEGARRKGRSLTRTLGFALALLLLLSTIDEVEEFDGQLMSVVAFPIYLVMAYALLRLGRLIRKGEADEEDGRGYADYLRALAGRAVQLVAIVGPLLAAFGYYNLATALLGPTTLTLAAVAFLATLHAVIRAAWGLARGLTPDEAHEALVPVLVSFALTLIALPFISILWGVRRTDLAEFWTHVSNGIRVGETTISPWDILTVILVFVIGLMVTRLIQGLLKTSVLPRTSLDKGGRNAIVSGLGYVGITLAALAGITAAGIDLSNLAIIVGALGVGIGFGLQNIVNNFVSGIILLIERPVGEGDWVDVNGNFGVVKSISVRSTVIETFDRRDVIVPNGDLISGTVTNWTRGNSIGRVIAPVGVAYGTDTRKVERILREVAEAHPIVSVEPPPFIYFKGFGADSLDFEIRAILTDVSYLLAVQSDLNHEIAKRFKEEGVEIPFAQRDIWLRNPETLREALPPKLAEEPAVEEVQEASEPPDRKLSAPDDGDSH